AFDLQVVDLSGLPKEDREEVALHISRENGQCPFDLLRGPVLRAILVRNDAQHHLLAMTTHHIAYDMWAQRIFVNELAALYEACIAGQPSPLEELEIQWVDYATWQRNWLQGEVLQQQFDYWRKKLAGAPPFLDLPVDLPLPAVQSYNGARQEFQLS